MRTTTAPETTSPEQQDAAEAAERANLAAEAERVMNESRPTPSQAEVDAIRTGKMAHDDKEVVDNPTMPSLHEQRERIAKARRAPYRSRAVEADEDRAGYRTRQAGADRGAPTGTAHDDDDKAKPKAPEGR